MVAKPSSRAPSRSTRAPSGRRPPAEPFVDSGHHARIDASPGHSGPFGPGGEEGAQSGRSTRTARGRRDGGRWFDGSGPRAPRGRARRPDPPHRDAHEVVGTGRGACLVPAGAGGRPHPQGTALAERRPDNARHDHPGARGPPELSGRDRAGRRGPHRGMAPRGAARRARRGSGLRPAMRPGSRGAPPRAASGPRGAVEGAARGTAEAPPATGRGARGLGGAVGRLTAARGRPRRRSRSRRRRDRRGPPRLLRREPRPRRGRPPSRHRQRDPADRNPRLRPGPDLVPLAHGRFDGDGIPRWIRGAPEPGGLPGALLLLGARRARGRGALPSQGGYRASVGRPGCLSTRSSKAPR